MALVFGAAGVGQAFSYSPDIAMARFSTVNVTRLLEHKPDIDVSSETGHRIDTFKQGNIQFKDVYFSYPSRCAPLFYCNDNRRPHEIVLRGLNIDIKPGQYVALVGPSGCGKSTVAALIERFYDPADGQVLIDNVPVSSYNLSDCRRNLALVSQEPT
jgi:ATP-binding cassette, subfamily B (MDR/TAP), member 1